MTEIDGNKIIASILKHDTKQNTYKIALLRSINDIVLAYPDMITHNRDVAIPLRTLARFWLAYYWAFSDEYNPIYQGVRSRHQDTYKNDVAFRPELTQLRQIWHNIYGVSDPADGFSLTNDLLVSRKHKSYLDSSPELIKVYNATIRKIMTAIEQPMRYAGTNIEGEFSVFRPLPSFHSDLPNVIGIPGTQLGDKCVVVPYQMWGAFQELSMWVEALCIHEWSLYIENIDQKDRDNVSRGEVFELLTARPDNRVPLTWERNRIMLLMSEGITFRCVWSKRELQLNDEYHLDHLVPVSIYPMNEMWNLVPTHPSANSKKSDRIPASNELKSAISHLEDTYRKYHTDDLLASALKEDSTLRFSTLSKEQDLSKQLAVRVTNFMEYIANARNLARVENF